MIKNQLGSFYIYSIGLLFGSLHLLLCRKLSSAVLNQKFTGLSWVSGQSCLFSVGMAWVLSIHVSWEPRVLMIKEINCHVPN